MITSVPRREEPSLRAWRMSRPPIGAKLTIAMGKPTQPAPSAAASQGVELVVHFMHDSQPPTGWVRDPHGTQRPFNGWLGLMGVLEDQCAPTPSTAPPNTIRRAR